MNIRPTLNTTTTDLAHAIQGKPRQDVFICRTTHYGGISPEYIVLVGGEYYEVHKYALAALQGGMTPEEIGLEPCADPDAAAEEAESDRIEAASLARHERSFKPGRM